MFNSKMQRYFKGKMWKKWWFFHATDFQSLMNPCFTFCRILGIFPYKINASTFETSKPRYILSTVVICICCAINLIIIHSLISKVNLGSVTRTLEAISFYMFNGFIMIVTHILSRPRMRLLQTILDISSKLPPESYQKLSKFIHFKDIFGIIFLIVQLYIYIFETNVPELKYLTTLPGSSIVVVFTIYLTLVALQINMLYMNCVCVLKACFKRINEDVAHIRNLTINDMSCIPRLLCYMPRNQLLLIKLKTLKKQHLIVSDAVKMLNIIFSLQILATIILIFSTITFELYFYVVYWQDGLLIISFNLHLLDVSILSLIFYTIKIILLVWACETGKNQAQELSTTIHDVLNRISDEKIKNELQLFSLQILHRENTFSAKGLTIDATLLATMIGNITTYMLILIQFLIASYCHEKSGINIHDSITKNLIT